MRQDIDINGYWKVVVLYDIWLGKLDTGFTHTNFNKKLSIVAISSASSQQQFLNTTIHELKHLQSHICKYYRVPEDSEEAAYLIGFVVQKMHKYLKHYV